MSAEAAEVETPEAVGEEIIPEAVREEMDKLQKITKRNFDLRERLKGRGLRRATLTLYLDEEKGPILGYAEDQVDFLGNKVGRLREGVIGHIDELQERLDWALASLDEAKTARSVLMSGTEAEAEAAKPEPTEEDFNIPALREKIAVLEKERDELVTELTKTALVVQMRAVPPVIHKDTLRRAKQTLGITAKNVPADMVDDVTLCQTAHMMTVVIQSITDNQTGEVNTGLTYDDAIALMEYLPVGQYDRLNAALGRLQFTDAISRNIEGQEDFS